MSKYSELQILYKYYSEEDILKDIGKLEKDAEYLRNKNILAIGDSVKKKVFLDELEDIQNTIETLKEIINERKV